MIPDFSDLFNKEGLAKCLDFLKSYKTELLSISLPLIVGFELIIVLLLATDYLGLGDSTGTYLLAILNFVYTTCLFLSIVLLLRYIEIGGEVTISTIKDFIKQRFWYTLISFIGLQLMVALGFLFLIIPGIVIAVKLTAMLYLISVDGFSFSDAVRYSFEGTNNIFWAIFIISFVLSLPAAVIYLIQLHLTSVIANSLISMFISLYSVLFYILGYIIYTEVKRRIDYSSETDLV